MDIQGNIRVVCRVRPALGDAATAMAAFAYPESDTMVVSGGGSSTRHTYEFDDILPPGASQVARRSHPSLAVLQCRALTPTLVYRLMCLQTWLHCAIACWRARTCVSLHTARYRNSSWSPLQAPRYSRWAPYNRRALGRHLLWKAHLHHQVWPGVL